MKIKRQISVMLAVLMVLMSLPCGAGTAEAISGEDINAPSAILVEPESFRVLYQKNPHEKRSVASITKVMTVLLIMEDIENGKISLSDTVTASEHSASMGGSDIWLEKGEQMSVDDMLKATLVASANDAAVALAEYSEGTEDAFVRRMNKRAGELGMKDTVFKNCNGLDEAGHVSSAYDVAVMSAELIKHAKVFDYTSIWLDFLRDGKTQIVNTNKLLKSYDGITGLKTGTTNEAGCCISATAERDGMKLIGVALGCDTGTERFKAAAHLLDYGFGNYRVVKPKAVSLKAVTVNKGMESKTGLTADSPKTVLTDKLSSSEIKTEVKIPESLDAPVKKNQIVGYVTYKMGDKEVQRVPVKAKNAVQECTFENAVGYIFSKLISM